MSRLKLNTKVTVKSSEGYAIAGNMYILVEYLKELDGPLVALLKEEGGVLGFGVTADNVIPFQA